MRTIMYENDERPAFAYAMRDQETGEFRDNTVTLGEDGVIAVLVDPETGEVNEWVTTDTCRETAVNVATWGDMHAIYDPDGNESPLVASMRHERELYGDCFGTEM